MSTRRDLTTTQATRIAGGGLLIALSVALLCSAWNGATGPTAAIEIAATLVTLVLAYLSRGWPRVGSVIVSVIAASGLWFTVVNTDAGGANEYASFYWLVLGFLAMILLSYFVTCANASGLFRRS